MANLSRLKAWVRYDGEGRLVGGGPILQKNKPKNGDWVEIDANDCCVIFPGERRSITYFASPIFRGGFFEDRASWWSGNTVANITATNPNYIVTGIKGEEAYVPDGHNEIRTFAASIDDPDPSNVVPNYTFFDGDGVGIMKDLRSFYDYAKKIIAESFFSTRGAVVTIHRASLPQVDIPIDGWFLVTIDFNSSGLEYSGYDVGIRQYDVITLPSTVTFPFSYNPPLSLDFIASSPLSPMSTDEPSTTWVNGVTNIMGWTIEEKFPIPGTW